MSFAGTHKMTLGQTLALTRPWWMWKNKEIMDALGVAKLRHCLPIIYQVLERNRQAGLAPGDLKELASPWFLARNPRNVERVEAGTYSLTDQHMLGLSIILKVPLATLSPACDVWLQGATRVLCGAELADVEARSYALYRLAGLALPTPCSDELDAAAIASVQRANPDSTSTEAIERAVWRASSLLGPVLERLEGKSR